MIDRELKDITKKSGIVFSGRVMGAIFGFLFSLIAARYMGAEVYGKITYVFTILILISVLTKLGLAQGLVQYISKLTEQNKMDERNSIITFSIFIVLIFSLLMSLFLFIFSDFIAANILNNNDLSSLIKLMSPLLIIFSLIELSPGIFRGIKIIKFHVLGKDILLSILKLITVTIVGYLGYKLNGLVFAYYFSFTIAGIYLFYKIYSLNLLGKVSKKYLSSYKDLIIFSYPLLMSGLLHFFINKTDIFMIGYFLNTSDVGVYTIALKIGTLTNFVLIAFNTIFAPNITSLYYNDQLTKLRKLYQVITKWIFGINIFVFSLILLLTKEIMTVFGTEFIVGTIALILIAIGQVVNASVGTAGSVNIMTGYPKSELYISVIVFSINITLNYLLIPIYGIEGAATASLVSVSVMNILRLIILYRRLNFQPYNKNYIKIIFSTLISYVICFFINQYLVIHYFLRMIVIGSIFLIIFVSFNYIFGLADEDKMILKSIKKKLLK